MTGADSIMQVWGHGTPRTFRVYWSLREFGLVFQQHRIRTRTEDMDAPEFLKVSPGKKIPAFEHGNLALTESAAIADYIFRLQGAVSDDLATNAIIERWTSFVLMEIDATALYVLRRHRDLPQIYGEAPAACDAAVEYYERQVSQVEYWLNDGREYVAGDAFSKADVVLASCALWANMYKLEVPRNVAQHLGRMAGRDAFAQAFADNFPDGPTIDAIRTREGEK